MRLTLTPAGFRIIFSLFLALFSQIVFAQTGGSISGSVKDKEFAEGVQGASVYLDGTKFGAACDINGNYKIEKIPAGSYVLIAHFFGYTPDTIKVVVVDGQNLVIDRVIGTEVTEMEGVVIDIQRNTGSEINIIEEKKNSDQVTEVIGSSEIAKTAASNTADVAKRVPGVTIQEGRFVIVRGLSQRYNAVLLNNALAPSSETDIKAFSFDVVPSSMIDRMVIYKTAAPELQGEFAGGVIKIYTKNLPDRTSLSIGYSAGVRQYTTFKTFQEQIQGDKFWLGFDDGTYNADNMPGQIPNKSNSEGARNELIAINGLFRNDVFLPTTKKAPIDNRFNLNFTGKINLGENVRLGNVTIVNYSNTYSNIEITRRGFNAYNKDLSKSDPTYIDKDLQYSHAVNLGIMHNWGLKLNDNHIIEFENLFNQLGNSLYTFREEENMSTGFYINDYFLRNIFRTMYSGQLTGNHTFEDIRTKIEWTGGYSKASRESPDYRRYRQQRNLDNPEEPLSTVIQTNVNPYYLGRLFSNTDEDIWMASANIEHCLKYSIVDSLKPIVKTGFYFENKERTFDVRNLGYRASFGNSGPLSSLSLQELFQPQNFNSQTGLLIGELSDPSFSYDAANRLFAYYLGIEIPLSEKLTIYPGVRVENNLQTLNSFRSDNGDPVYVNNNITRYLPSLSINYAIKKNTSILRFAFAETLNRPEFREIAPLNYYDFELNQSIIGNPDLKTPKIYNFDLRYEFYPREGETYAIGVFYKKFYNPIEMYYVESNNPVFTFDNAPDARSIGVEMEIKKSLDVLDFKPLNNFSFSLNAALISSKIDIGDSKIQNNERPMQGQSPYIVNASIYYNNDKLNWKVNAIYNVIGRRIFIVGNTMGYPDVYEMPRNALDITSTWGVGKYMEVRVTLQNIINQKYQFIQDANDDGKFSRSEDQETIGYKTGRYFTLGFVGKF